MENIVRIEDLASHIAEAVRGVHDGVARLRAQNIEAQLPEKVDFDMVVVVGWQALAMESSITGTQQSTAKNTEHQTLGGGNTETTNATDTDDTTSNENGTASGAQSHSQSNYEDLT